MNGCHENWLNFAENFKAFIITIAFVSFQINLFYEMHKIFILTCILLASIRGEQVFLRNCNSKVLCVLFILNRIFVWKYTNFWLRKIFQTGNLRKSLVFWAYLIQFKMRSSWIIRHHADFDVNDGFYSVVSWWNLLLTDY